MKILRNLRQWEDAQGLVEESLEQMSRVQGTEHPNALRVKHSLAVAMSALGQHDGA